MAAAEDDESWLYGESIQDEKGENERPERRMSDDERDDSNQDETSRVSRFSSDDPPGVSGKEDRSNASSPTPSAETTKRTSDDREAGELSGEEESAAATVSAPEKENVENKEDGGDGVDDGDAADGAEDGDGADGDIAPPGTAGSDDSDSDDDSVQVTIGDIKAGPPAYGYSGPPVNLNIKRGGAYQPSGVGGQTTGKGKGVDLESVGMINGVPTYEFNLDSMEDKPWRKPGADITDYFNYGFNEDTWKAYCEKQRKLRLEANGVLGPLTPGVKVHPTAKDQQIPIATVNENSKYAGALGKKAGPPPGRKISGSIDVIGASTTTSRRAALTAPKENVIQVVPVDKREYNRKPFIDTGMPPPPPGVIPPGLPIFPDLSMPPPGMPPPGMPPPGLPPPNMPLLPGVMPTFGEPFDAYNRSYPPPPGVPLDRPPPGFDNSFDGSYFNGSNSGQDPYNPFEPTADGPWESREGGSRYHKKDWDYHGRSHDRSPPRSPNGEEFERRHRDYRERDRDRSRDRDRDRERDRERERTERGERDRDRERERHSESRHRDRERDRESRTRDYEPEERRERDRSERGESERRHREHRDRDEKHREHREHRDKDEKHSSRSSRRKHREETDETEHRSSRHKRKRSKREKEEDGSSAAGGGSSTGGAAAAASEANDANESQDAPADNQDEDSQPE